MFQWLRSLVGIKPGPSAAGRPAIRGRYDNATTTPENQRNWWSSDYLSAKASNTYAVRRVLRARSRYEVSNNPYLFGITNNNADDLIGTGPTLQIQTGDAAYNRAVERSWAAWCREVDWAEKIRTTKLAKSVDGEGFLVLKTVPDLEHPVKLYPCDLEADQVTTPAPANVGEFWVDGLTLHPVTGRPVSYHVLRNHPGDFFFPDLNPLAVDKISARFVIHWFHKFRPGQVRGVPVFTPSLDLFAELRSYRRAVLGAAELAADFAAVLEQDRGIGAFAEEDTDEELEAFKRVPIDRRMMTTLPPGAKMSQFDARQPTTSYEMFQEKCLGEAVRPLAYPLNLALGTSQKFNFSSSKLDIINYRSSLSVEREECERVVLRRVFAEWFAEAVLSGAVPAYDGLNLPPHDWHWPGFESIDPAVDADSDHSRLSNGTDTWRDFWARRGKDWKDVLVQQQAEREQIEKAGVRFGQPATLTVTEDGDDPAAEGDDDAAPPPKAKARRRRGFTATKDDNGQEHDENGRFGEGGSGSGKKDDDKDADAKGGDTSKHDATHEKWIDKDNETYDRRSEQTEKVDAKREKEDEKVEAKREKEDAAHEKKEEAHEAKRDKVDAAREKADEKRDAAREKEDAAHEKKLEKLEAEREKVEARREKEDDDLEAKREKEDAAVEKARDKEDGGREPDKDTADKRFDEDFERAKARREEDEERAAAREKEDEEHAEQAEKLKAEREEVQAKREEEDAELKEERAAEDAELDREKAEIEREGKARQAAREHEDAERKAARGREDAEQQAKWDAEDAEEYHRRKKSDPAAHDAFYKPDEHAKHSPARRKETEKAESRRGGLFHA